MKPDIIAQVLLCHILITVKSKDAHSVLINRQMQFIQAQQGILRRLVHGHVMRGIMDLLQMEILLARHVVLGIIVQVD